MWKRLSLLWTVLRGDVRLLWFALRHPLAPRWLKPALALVGLYLLSPVDLLPDTLPLLGVVRFRAPAGLSRRGRPAACPTIVARVPADQGTPR
jgi:hypothetical protein